MKAVLGIHRSDIKTKKNIWNICGEVREEFLRNLMLQTKAEFIGSGNTSILRSVERLQRYNSMVFRMQKSLNFGGTVDRNLPYSYRKDNFVNINL